MNERYPLTCDYGATYAAVEAGSACATLINAALVGAVVGGSAAAHNARRIQRNEIELADALLPTGRSAVASAAATALTGVTPPTQWRIRPRCAFPSCSAWAPPFSTTSASGLRGRSRPLREATHKGYGIRERIATASGVLILDAAAVAMEPRSPPTPWP